LTWTHHWYAHFILYYVILHFKMLGQCYPAS